MIDAVDAAQLAMCEQVRAGTATRASTSTRPSHWTHPARFK